MSMTLETQAIRPVPFREVRHDQPDDCVHYEPVATRFAAMNWTIPVSYTHLTLPTKA